MAQPVSRRNLLLGTAGLAVGTAATGGMAWSALRSNTPSGPDRVMASAAEVTETERARRARGTGRTVRAALTAEPTEVDLGGRIVRTWAYNGQVPGPLVRCSAGDRLEVDLHNRLPEPTTVHWHGVRIRNDMDGVPHLTQDPVQPGSSTRYSFTAPDPGTYWLHPHVGLQREHGLHAPLIIDDPRERGDYDVEFVVVLDDWLDGAADSPERVLELLRPGDMHARYRTPVQAGRIDDLSASWQYDVPAELADPPPGITPVPANSRMASSVEYPFYLLNGRLPTDPQTLRAKPGQRARIRLINAAGATAFRVALGGHRMTVTHTDGFPVEPIAVDALQVASGERYDVTVELGDGVFPLVGVAEGKGAQAFGLIRTASGAAPAPSVQPAELGGELLRLADLRAAPTAREGTGTPRTSHSLYLTGDMYSFSWRINAQNYDHQRPFDGITPLDVRAGEVVRLEMINQTHMYHPMHLHGHTFTVRAIADTGGRSSTPLPQGTRKDTVMVGPGQRLTADFTADNPGQWLVHCHNAYHMATGMAAMLSYLR
jgi:multicopper oxidase